MSDGRRRGPTRYWTPARLFELAGLIEGGWSDEAIAEHFQTTANGVRLARKRNGIRPRSVHLLSTREVQRLLGLRCAKAVARWIERGYLQARRGQRWGNNRQWYITRAALETFLDEPAYWHLWQPERLTDPWQRAVYSQRRTERYLTQTEVAARYCVQRQTVASWFDKGVLPCVRLGGRGNRLVPESALAGFIPPGQRGKAGMVKRQWRADEVRRLFALRADGWSWPRIAQELGRSVSSVHNHYVRLTADERVSA